MNVRLRRLLALVILLPWLASLFLPVFQIGSEGGDSGYGYLLFGWMGLLIGEWGWIGNPFLLLVVWALTRRRDHPKTLLVCAIVLGIVVLSELMRSTIVDNEGGVERTITAKLSGFYCWVAALAAAAVTALFQWALILRARRATSGRPEDGGFARWEAER